jgi:hypothetical protein
MQVCGFCEFCIAFDSSADLEKTYLSFKIFSKNNVQHGLFMLFWLGMFLGTASIQNTFAVGVLGYDQVTNARLSLLMIPGILAEVLRCFGLKRETAENVHFFRFFSNGRLCHHHVLFNGAGIQLQLVPSYVSERIRNVFLIYFSLVLYAG